MKYFFKKIIVVVFCIQLIGCIKEYELPNDLIVHDFVWKGLNAYYLYQNEVDDLSDRRFSSDVELENYLNGFSSYQNLFSSLLISQDVISVLVEDYNSIETIPELRETETNGLEFGIIAEPNSNTNVIGYVTHILPSSNASSEDIQRGDFFNEIDGIQLTRANYENLLLNGNDSFEITKINFDGTTITPIPLGTTEIVPLIKQTYVYPAVFSSTTLPVNSDNVGYLMYNNDFSENYLEDLNNTFNTFKSDNINKLIIDLRYNIGGGSFAKNITTISSMLLADFTDETLIKKQFNTKAQSWFEANQPDSLVTKVTTNFNEITPINSVAITDVYIILNGENHQGSPAVELLINSLLPFLEVHLFGNQTNGDNLAKITLYDSEDYNFENRNLAHTVALQPTVLSFLNKDDETYVTGFSTNGNLCVNEDPLNLGIIADESDPTLKNILEYIETGVFNNPVVCPSDNFEFIFNSIDSQREDDNGLFINQSLPFTN